jgi:predicted phosphodiesterase
MRVAVLADIHGSARDDNEFILVDSPISHYQAAFASAPEPTVDIGHTHMPFDRLADTRRVINPGSVGLPYGHSGAAWALLGPDVTLRRTAYDARAAAAVLAAAASDLPGNRGLHRQRHRQRERRRSAAGIQRRSP